MVSQGKSWLAVNYRWIMVVVLLVAVTLRVIGINNLSPPGLEHDEVAHWLINRDILASKHGLYFTEAYGHEAAYHYFQTLFMILLGDNAFALRLPSAVIGLLLVAVSFALARRLFGLQTALIAASLLAVLFWPIFYSRLGLRAISLPMISGISAYYWWKGWDLASPIRSKPVALLDTNHVPIRSILQTSLWWFALAGLLAGISFYTYMASRIVPVIYLAYTGYLILLQREMLFKERRQGILLFFIIYLIIAAPLGIYLLTNPGIEVRIGEVDRPLRMLMVGDFKPVLENAWLIISMFGIKGDPLWRQNVAYMPVYEPILAIFFYFGLLISLWRWRQPRYLFIIFWLFLSTIPSLVTIDAPSSIRIINVLPVLAFFPAIGFEVIHFFSRLSTVSTKLSPKNARILVSVSILGILTLYISRTAIATYQTWPTSAEVQFVWQKALTDAAAYMDAEDDISPVAIGGWTPETMDEPTMILSLKRNDLNLRYFYPLRSVIIPNPDDQPASRLILPENLGLAPPIENIIKNTSPEKRVIDSFLYYRIPGNAILQPNRSVNAEFGQEITLLGYDVYPSTSHHEMADGTIDKPSSLTMITYWQVNQSTNEPRRIFVHIVDEETSQIIAQDDALDAPAKFWEEGDIILQMHELALPNFSSTEDILIGIYNPITGMRLQTPKGEEFVSIENIYLESK